MTRAPIWLTIIALPELLALCGCDAKLISGPPQLRLGRDLCSECGMIISEERCSAALLVERVNRREYALFDDIGCMLDWERERPDEAVVLERHVHDYATRQWITALEATFLLADPEKLATPMSSGFAAFSNQASAETAKTQYGGETLDEAGLASARKAWLDKRRAASSQSSG